MLHITKVMIAKFDIHEMDFMGYSLDKEHASFHHLIIPRREGGPKTIDNGAVLNSFTSHPYLHIIEEKDYELFYLITSEMIDQNIRRRLDLENIRRINDLLNYFEREHCGDINFNGEPLIKEKYVKRLLYTGHK